MYNFWIIYGFPAIFKFRLEGPRFKILRLKKPRIENQGEIIKQGDNIKWAPNNNHLSLLIAFLFNVSHFRDEVQTICLSVIHNCVSFLCFCSYTCIFIFLARNWTEKTYIILLKLCFVWIYVACNAYIFFLFSFLWNTMIMLW